jgi:ABC-type tungstate transport system substrate-binding protein
MRGSVRASTRLVFAVVFSTWVTAVSIAVVCEVLTEIAIDGSEGRCLTALQALWLLSEPVVAFCPVVLLGVVVPVLLAKQGPTATALKVYCVVLLCSCFLLVAALCHTMLGPLMTNVAPTP